MAKTKPPQKFLTEIQKRVEKYIRTDPNILEEAAMQCTSKPASEVCYQMSLDDSSLAPKYSRQIHDKKYRDSKKTTQKTHNIADEVLAVISQINENPFVQKIVLEKGKAPSVILYTKEILADLKSNCLGEGGSVLGIDRTFNLGKCFVSSFTYKNLGVYSRKTNDHPLILGPVLLHWDGEAETYSTLFSELKSKLGDGELIFGSDEERAIMKAMRHSFGGFNISFVYETSEGQHQATFVR